ncbi:hypothetical protein GA0061083_1855 [Pseudarthrobacter enclensis]|nr:hypothetical protein GA0061083_1855 [Pseudarthrobacter enclensis]
MDGCGRAGPVPGLPPAILSISGPVNRGKTGRWGPLPIGRAQVYPFAMSELPASYKDFLSDKSEMFISTVKPVLQQSAADKLHGVRVTYNPGSTGHQAHIDDTLPFGVVFEDID